MPNATFVSDLTNGKHALIFQFLFESGSEELFEKNLLETGFQWTSLSLSPLPISLSLSAHVPWTIYNGEYTVSVF